MDKHTDRRLIAAYARLLKKDEEKISVSYLCEKADVARATFYIHYKDLNDFKQQLRNRLIDKFFEQATAILACDEKEFERAIKKENLIFDEDELIILKFMISGTKYIDFGLQADEHYSKNKSSSLFSLQEWERYEIEINAFSRGYLPFLLLGITGYYDEKQFRSDMRSCRMFYKLLKSNIHM